MKLKVSVEGYLSLIKKHLRDKKMNYKKLGQRIGMSESGVKKMFNGKDISLHRVIQISIVLNLPVSKLFGLGEFWGIKEKRFTDYQEKALLGNVTLKKVFWFFAIEKNSVEEIAKKLELSMTQVKSFLQKLVSLELIEQSRNLFLHPSETRYRISEDSELGKNLNSEGSHFVLRRALVENHENRVMKHRLVSMKLTSEAYEHLAKEVSEAIDRAVQKSELEEWSRSGSQKMSSILWAQIDSGIFD